MPSMLWTLIDITLSLSTGKSTCIWSEGCVVPIVCPFLRLATYDDQIREKLTQRFVDMKIDTKNLLDFEQMDRELQVELLRSAHLKFIGK